MSWVVVKNARVASPNPAPLTSDFRFEITFSCLHNLPLPLQWRLIYVGNPADKSRDQELENVEIGPLSQGSLKFTLEADPPDFAKIDPQDIHGPTVVLLEASYRGQEFLRIGWYVHNTYVDPVLEEDPPDVPMLDRMERYIVGNEPRVTRFQIKWEPAVEADNVPAAHVSDDLMIDSTTADEFS